MSDGRVARERRPTDGRVFTPKGDDPHLDRLRARARGCDAGAQFALWDRTAPRRGALRWLERAAEQGHARARGELGWYYATDARPRRPDLSVLWWRRAAAQGLTGIQTVLGETLRDGVGVRENRKVAYRWFLEAARKGDAAAQRDLGYALFHGEGVARDPLAARVSYRRAAAHGGSLWPVLAMLNLGRMAWFGQGVSRNARAAIHWARKASRRGSHTARRTLAVIYESRRGAENGRMAVRWLEKAAAGGDPWALRTLALRHLEGRGARRDRTHALSLRAEAARAGDADARTPLARGAGAVRRVAGSAKRTRAARDTK